MLFPPLGKCTAHPTSAGDIETGGELADVMENQEAARSERRIPKIELGQGRFVLVRTVDDDQLRVAAEIFPSCLDGSRIERVSFGNFDELLELGPCNPPARQLTHGRIEIQAEQAAPRVHPAEHPA